MELQEKDVSERKKNILILVGFCRCLSTQIIFRGEEGQLIKTRRNLSSWPVLCAPQIVGVGSFYQHFSH